MDLPNNKILGNISYQNGLFLCKRCPYSTKEAKLSRDHAKQHQENQTGDGAFRQGQVVNLDPKTETELDCKISQMVFANKSELQEHPNSDNPGLDLLNNKPLTNCSYKDGVFSCKKCPYFSERSSLMREHTENHEDKEEDIFMSIDPSEQINATKRKFHCDLCGLSFVTNFKLNRHKNSVHFKLRQHKCTSCTYSATRLEHLREHNVSVHGRLDEQVHKCAICNHLFANNHKLQRHKKTHFNIREHNCDLCNYSASRFEHLKSHKLSAHNVQELLEQDPLTEVTPNITMKANEFLEPDSGFADSCMH